MLPVTNFSENSDTMSVLFCVPAQGQERFLDVKVAGLPLWKRLYQHALRSGMIPRFIVRPGTPISYRLPRETLVVQEADMPCGFDKAVFCKPGILPDISCLEAMGEENIPQGALCVKDGLLGFVPSPDCFEFGKAFGTDGFKALKDFLFSYLTPREVFCKGAIFSLRSKKEIKRAEKQLFKGLVKDTEGFMSRHVERPISLFISKRIVNTSITPNQITIISTLIGLIGALFISIGQGFWQIAGALLFLAHSIIDGCDGEIARIKFMESRLGGILDFWGDNLVHAAVFGAIGIEWARRTDTVFPLYLSAAAVIGTMLSASIVYFSTMRKKKGSRGPLYTSVSSTQRKGKIAEVADFLSRRDFIYLVVILAFFNHLDWFLVVAAVGSLVFAGMLIWIRLKG